jgi:hypothetical protein
MTDQTTSDLPRDDSRPTGDAPDYEPTNPDTFTGEAADRVLAGMVTQIEDRATAESGQPEPTDDEDAGDPPAAPDTDDDAPTGDDDDAAGDTAGAA